MLRKRQWRVFILSVAVMAGWMPNSSAENQLNNSPLDRVMAIDVLLVPDATMVAMAHAANAKLRVNYSRGYTLGRNQVAHISLVHRYVREKDLPAIETALKRLLARQDPTDWTLTANGYAYAIWADVAITNIAIEHTPKLDKFERDVVKAVEPFAVRGGTKTVFHTTHELPTIDNEIIDYVENFTTKSAGPKYKPHVTIGVAHEDFVKQLKAAPFKKFSFKPAGVAIYQLGNFGTAQKKLWEWKPM